MSMLLEASFSLRRAALALHIEFTLSVPWTCLFGASGSGKSTLLRALAGAEQPDSGHIRLGSHVLFDHARRIAISMHQRPIRMAAQRSWLFPGTVRDNILYGVSGRVARNDAETVLDRLDLRPLAGRQAAQLSGGEQQRVAIARAVAAALFGSQRAHLLLLDEPFNGMDALRRDALATSLREWLAAMRMPVLSVTHDLAEVFLLNADVIRLEAGRISAQGRPQHVLADDRLRLLRTLGEQSVLLPGSSS